MCNKLFFMIFAYEFLYRCNFVPGMMVVPLRVHNVILGVSAPWLRRSGEVEEWVGDVKIRLQFGVQRRRVTIRLSCDAGMDKRTLVFALNRAYDLFERETGRRVENVVVKTFEVNRDFHGVRLDGGLKCYTRKGFFEFIDRVYQKGEGVVRAEVKVSREVTPDELLALVHGGVPSFEVTQGVFVLSQKVEKLTEALKFQNELLSKVVRLNEALMNEVIKLKERLG